MVKIIIELDEAYIEKRSDFRSAVEGGAIPPALCLTR